MTAAASSLPPPALSAPQQGWPQYPSPWAQVRQLPGWAAPMAPPAQTVSGTAPLRLVFRAAAGNQQPTLPK
eukprot:2477305-Heterocapsa_arctica.AAC.1